MDAELGGKRGGAIRVAIGESDIVSLLLLLLDLEGLLKIMVLELQLFLHELSATKATFFFKSGLQFVGREDTVQALKED